MRNLTVVLLLILSVKSFGQEFNKGDKVLKGSFSLNRSENDGSFENVSTGFSINPSFGVMVSENLEVGLLTGYFVNITKSQNSPQFLWKQGIQGFNAGVYIQRYLKLSEKFYITLSGSVAYKRDFNESTTSNLINGGEYSEKSRSRAFNVAVNPGLIFFPTEKLAVNANIGGLSYNRFKASYSEGITNSLSTNFGAVYLGLSYFFRKKI